MPLLPHFGTYNLQQQKASKLKFLLQQKFGFFGQNILSASYFGLGSQENLRIH
jgi:hypothetical protein